jgi:hypothetical protein
MPVVDRWMMKKRVTWRLALWNTAAVAVVPLVSAVVWSLGAPGWTGWAVLVATSIALATVSLIFLCRHPHK